MLAAGCSTIGTSGVTARENALANRLAAGPPAHVPSKTIAVTAGSPFAR
jgi:hypothetical protein